MQSKITSFDFLRFLAAIVVINFHYGKTIFGLDHFFCAGQQMVTLFFVLSGFVIYLSSSQKPDISFFIFFQKRISRILPLYFLALFMMVIFFYFDNRIIDATSLTWHILGLHSLMPKYTLAFNYPDWYISTQIILYFLALPLFFAIKKCSLQQSLFFTILGWIFTQIALILVLESKLQLDPITLRGLVFYFPTTHLCSFALGMAAAKYFQNNTSHPTNNFLISVFMFLILVLLLENYKFLSDATGLNIPFGGSFFAPTFALALYIFGKYANFEIFSNSTIKTLGDASFAIYILHAPIHFALLNFFDLNNKSVYQYGYYLILTIVIGILAHKYIEQKCAKLLESFFRLFSRAQ